MHISVYAAYVGIGKSGCYHRRHSIRRTECKGLVGDDVVTFLVDATSCTVTATSVLKVVIGFNSLNVELSDALGTVM